MLTAHEMKAEILTSYKNELGSREEERKSERARASEENTKHHRRIVSV